MKYLSVCSGIEAASVAWHPLGWEPVGFAEIEKFPSQVLAHRFPGVKNFGDMTKFKEWNLEPETIDLLVGGTPCQAFSVAGLRKGLADPRGNLALTFVAMVDFYRPEWVVWENVPGVLSSNGGRDFGAFLGALGQLGYGFAYRVLDAQYFGVAQRRRRVFVVAHSSGDPTRAAEVLFERESLCGDPPPSREAGQDIATSSRGGSSAGRKWPAEVAPTLNVMFATKLGLEDQHVFGGAGCFVLSSGQANAGISQDQAHTLTSLHETQIVAGIPNVVGALTAQGPYAMGAPEVDANHYLPIVQPSLYESHPQDCRVTGPVEQCPTVSAKWGTGGNNTPLVTDGATHFRKSKRAQSVNDDETWVESEVTNTMNVFDQGDVRATDVVVQPGEASAFSWQCRGDMRRMVSRPTAQLQRCQIEAVMVQPVAHTLRGEGFDAGEDGTGRGTPIVPIQTPAMHVRRLTPVECERLQGFPDGWTDIRPNGKDTPDSPRYKALGNSMAVPVMRWIGQRIESCR